MRRLINYLRSLFCKHEWEYLGSIKVFDVDHPTETRPRYIIDRWRCTKCGYVVRSKI